MDTREQPSSSTHSFGALLRRYRTERGLSQEDLAALAGLSAHSISALERDLTHWPYRDTVARLAAALGLEATTRRTLEAAARRPAPRPVRTADVASAPPSSAGAVVQATSETRPTPLPHPLTTLIGRVTELEHLCALLTWPAVRLLTVTGPGGIGKTRLAIEAAHRLQEQHGASADGVIFVELAPLQDGELLWAALAQALGVRDAQNRALSDAIISVIDQRRVLLVLDNCEHLIEACAALAGRLLATCPRLCVLATSRTVLRLRGEQVLPLAPLALPAPVLASCSSSFIPAGEHGSPVAPLVSAPSLVALRDSPAVALFVERAAAVNPAFTLSAANAADVAAICQRLDGLPLAIELAAAHCAALSPRALLTRLAPSLPLLTGGARDLPQRQQTLRAAIAWSYDLLPATEQRVFRALAVCVGGCDIETAAALGALDTTDPLALLYHLELLVGASLLVPVQGEADAARFTMLETLRDYGREMLAAHGELNHLQARHAAYFCDLALVASAHLHGADQKVWLDRLDLEHDNMRAALAWALGSGAIEQGLRLAVALARFWSVRGHLSEGRRWLGRFLAVGADVAPLVRASGAREAGTLATYQGDYAQSALLLADSLTLCRELGDVPGILATLHRLADLTYSQGDFGRAETLFGEVLTLAREESDALAIAIALNGLGNIANERGDYAVAAAR